MCHVCPGVCLGLFVVLMGIFLWLGRRFQFFSSVVWRTVAI